MVLDGAAVTQASRRVTAGSVLRVAYEPQADPQPRADAGVVIDVVHEDPDVLVVNKPAGVIVHPGAGHRDGTLVNGLLALVSEPGRCRRPSSSGHRAPVGRRNHRVAGRGADPTAYERLVEMMAGRQVRREYLALCAGVIEPEAGLIDAPIGRSPRDPTSMAVVAGGRPARTEYRRLSVGDGVSLVSCRLETGRTHQIRVHLRAHGHPVRRRPTVRGRRPVAGRRPAHAARRGAGLRPSHLGRDGPVRSAGARRHGRLCHALGMDA